MASESWFSASVGGSAEVKNMYEKYPFPKWEHWRSYSDHFVRIVKEQIYANKDLDGYKILDAGCGTADKLLGFAESCPDASFLGIDLTEGSLEIAKQKLLRSRMQNVELQLANIMEFETSVKFDLIVSAGVIHHLPNPEQGLRQLSKCMKDDAAMVVMLYGFYGEFNLLAQREIIIKLLEGDLSRLEAGAELIQELGFTRQAGNYTNNFTNVWDQTTFNIDGYLHPIVNTYKFNGIASILAKLGFEWWSPEVILCEKGRFSLELETVNTLAAFETISTETIFSKQPKVNALFQKLPKKEKLNILELLYKPTGFYFVTGNNNTLKKLSRRTQANALILGPG